MLSAKQNNALIKTLQERVAGLCCIYLFGSRAGDNKYVTSESDYDIAFDADYDVQITGLETLSLLSAVMKAVGSDRVDLIDMRKSMGHVFRRSIIDGERLWVDDLSRTHEREAQWIKVANDFKISERSLADFQITELLSRVKS